MTMSVAVLEGRRIQIRGTVQGFGFRPWVYRMARQAGVSGRVHNDAADVTVEVFGDLAALEQFIERLHADPPPAARISGFQQAPIPAELVRRVVRTFGQLPIVASGGCFQNARLAESIRAALAPGHDVRLHALVPPGDGGIALGQALIADAITRGD